MNKQTVIILLSENLKLIRNEANYTQDEFAKILGLSKKTIVQIEKKRALINWTTVIALCSLFSTNKVILSLFEDEPINLIRELSLHFDDEHYYTKSKTLGGTVFWDNLEENQFYKFQKHNFSQFFRILDEQNYRIYSSFEEEAAHDFFKKITQQKAK